MKRSKCIALLLLLTLAMAACSPMELIQIVASNLPGGPKTTTANTLYYNSTFGLQIAPPKGWFIETKVDANVSTDPEARIELSSMERTDPEAQYYFYDLLTLGSTLTSSDPAHAALDISVYHDADYASLDELAAYWQSAMQQNTDSGYARTYIGHARSTLADRPVIQLDFYVEQDEGDPYYEYYLLLDLDDNGHYLFFYLNYWDDAAAPDISPQALLEDSICLSAPKESSL